MATHEEPPAPVFTGHPQSPPMTPGPRSQRYPPQAQQTSPLHKRVGMYKSAQTPPLEFIEPTGQDHQFTFTRPHSMDPSCEPSTDSGRAYATATSEQSERSDAEEESDGDFDEESEEDDEEERQPVPLRVEKAQFVLEDLDSDTGYDCDIEVIRGYCEDAKSDRSGTRSEVLAGLKNMQIEEDSSDEEERELQERRYREKKKRWSAGIFKRSHSQSVEGDSSYSDNDPLDDVDPTARRLRRRVRGPADRRGSLIFEDRGFSNTNNIAEVDEPEEGRVMHSKGPPSIPSDDAFTLDELPFWNGGESMDFDIESA